MEKIRYIIASCIVFISLLWLSSCEDEIEVDLRTADPQLVIEGVLPAKSLAEVRITKTKSFSETNEYEPIRDAIVRLSSDKGENELLQLTDSGTYVTTSIRGAERVTYTLEVEYENNKYMASSRIPPVVMIDSLTLFDFPVVDYPFPMIYFVDPEGEENDYYRFVVYVNENRPDTRQRLFSAEFMDGLEINQMIGVSTEEEEDPIQQGDKIMVEMQCLDKGVYTFWETLSRIDNSLTNPTSNIKGGALGYFSAYSFDKKGIIAVW